MPKITCKLKDVVGSGIKAHIIPKAFYLKGEAPLLIVNNSAHPKKNQTGLWDDEIVTKEGEKVLSDLDDYGYKVLVERESEYEKIFHSNGELVALKLDKNNYHKFKLFCLSILWRMSVSLKTECSGVKLGPHESKIRSMLLEGDALSPEDYSVTMSYFEEEYTAGLTLFPVKEKIEGTNYYRLHFGKFMALIKIDSRKTPSVFAESQLSPDKPLILITRNYPGSPEASLFNHVHNLNKNRFPHWFIKEAGEKK